MSDGMTKSCCPNDSILAFFDDYSTKGCKSTVNGVDFYATGEPKANGSVIVVIPDIWGWDSGRTRRIADLLSDIVDYVIVPKLLEPSFEGGTDGDGLPPEFNLNERGKECFAWLAQFKYDGPIKPKMDVIFNYLNDLGMTQVGMLGFCWGGYVIAHCSADHANIVCAASPHPSIKAEDSLYGGNFANLAARIQCPFLLLPAGNDPPDYSPGGEFFDIVKNNHPTTKSVAFPDMSHGFLSRGDISDPSGKMTRDISEATALLQTFFKEHMLRKE